MSLENGPGEGAWSTFAEKVAAERDAARRELREAQGQLDSIRLQFNSWRGGHVFDNKHCLLCGKPGPENAPQLCAMEVYLRQYKERA